GTIDGTYDLKLYFNGAFADLEDYKFNILSRTTGSSSGADWTLTGTASQSTAATGYAYRKGMSTFSEKAIGETGIALPVELLSFRATCLGDYVNTSWATASELNSDYFTVERSYDLSNWETVGTKQSAGNSNSEKLYDLSDYSVNMNSTNIYYRLKQTDYNGNFEYFDPVTINCSDELTFEVISVAKDGNDLNFDYIGVLDENIKIALYNSAGQLVYNQNIISKQGLNKCKIQGVDLKSGLYFLSLETIKNYTSKKIILP
ncbi:MAG: T9SS type A sorting domain-containing protein, partial [Bacteroidota bacterium]